MSGATGNGRSRYGAATLKEEPPPAIAEDSARHEPPGKEEEVEREGSEQEGRGPALVAVGREISIYHRRDDVNE